MELDCGVEATFSNWYDDWASAAEGYFEAKRAEAEAEVKALEMDTTDEDAISEEGSIEEVFWDAYDS